MAAKTSAVADQDPVDVLIALHSKFDLLDFAGPMEVLATALHENDDPCEYDSTIYLFSLPHLENGPPVVLFAQSPLPFPPPSSRVSSPRRLGPTGEKHTLNKLWAWSQLARRLMSQLPAGSLRSSPTRAPS